MDAAIDRIMHTYDLLMNRSAAATAEARAALREAVRCRAGAQPACDPKKPGSRFCEAARRALHRARDTCMQTPAIFRHRTPFSA